MHTEAYKLEMTAPFHVGTVGMGKQETLDYYPSTTFFSALVISWLEMGKKDWVDKFPLDTDIGQGVLAPPLQITSAFPYVGDILLLPCPILPIAPAADDANQELKSYRKVHWVSTSIFKAMLEPGVNLSQLWKTGELLQENHVLMSREEARYAKSILRPDEHGDYNLWEKPQRAHVAIDRISGAGNLYFVGGSYFQPETGLWCMASSQEESWLKLFKNSLHHLADSGIGGQRSRGYGRFTLQCMEKPPDLGGQSTGDYEVLLSLVAPSQAQMALLTAEHSRYALRLVGGLSLSHSYNPAQSLTSTTIRHPVRMVKEGSVIKREQDGKLAGRLLNVRAQTEEGGHEIHLYGYGYGIPYQPA